MNVPGRQHRIIAKGCSITFSYKIWNKLRLSSLHSESVYAVFLVARCLHFWHGCLDRPSVLCLIAKTYPHTMLHLKMLLHGSKLLILFFTMRALILPHEFRQRPPFSRFVGHCTGPRGFATLFGGPLCATGRHRFKLFLATKSKPHEASDRLLSQKSIIK